MVKPQAFCREYERREVEHLLPYVFMGPSAYAYGVRGPMEMPEDMPRSQSNPAHAGELNAAIADVKFALQYGPLISGSEKRLMYDYYAHGSSQKQIAADYHYAQTTVSYKLYSGVGKILATLNGGDHTQYLSEEESREYDFERP